MSNVIEVEGYWIDQPNVGTMNVLVSTASYPDDDEDDSDDIFWYTDGDPVNVGDMLDQFRVTKVWG